VHFLDAWAALPPLDLLRFAVPAALLLVAVLVPGRLTARLAALGLAVSLLFLRELGRRDGLRTARCAPARGWEAWNRARWGC
jgi:hypothetical protein